MKIPEHIAIIMDGNGKWAKKRLLPKNLAHKKGADIAMNIVKLCKQLGVKYLTLYAFSLENWNRPEDEVKSIMDLFRQHLKTGLPQLIEENIKIKFLGSKAKLDDDIIKLMKEIETNSLHNEFTLLIAINYSAKSEIRKAALDFAKNVVKNNLDLDSINDIYFDKFFQTHDIPDPDLLIRTGGESRLSNFLLWQLSYSELYFTDVLWPDFREENLMQSIEEFSHRDRRYGR